MTRYEVLDRPAVKKVVERRVAQARMAVSSYQSDLHSDLEDQVKPLQGPPNEDETPLSDTLEEARLDIEELIQDIRPESRGADKIEAQAAVILYRALVRHRIPVEVLDNGGFWAHLSVAFLWNFAVWRHYSTFRKLVRPGEPLDDVNPSAAEENEVDKKRRNWLEYVDGARGSECIASRLYLRVNCLGGEEYSKLAVSGKQGADFWRSHILRVKQGEYPSIVRAMVQRQSDPELYLSPQNRGPLRRFARNLNHHLVNFEMEALTDEDQNCLVNRLWREQLEPEARSAVE